MTNTDLFIQDFEKRKRVVEDYLKIQGFDPREWSISPNPWISGLLSLEKKGLRNI